MEGLESYTKGGLNVLVATRSHQKFSIPRDATSISDQQVEVATSKAEKEKQEKTESLNKDLLVSDYFRLVRRLKKMYKRSGRRET